MSLDVEGSELPILQTIPFNKVDIRTIMIEVNHSPKVEVFKLMTSNGYRFVKELYIDMVFTKDEIPEE